MSREIINAYVKVFYEENEVLEPLEDFLDRNSMGYGFDNYKDLRNAGYSILIPANLYDKDGNLLSSEDVSNIKSNMEIVASKENIENEEVESDEKEMQI